MLKQGGVYRENQEVATRVMDRMDQEKERGITIISKHTAISFGDIKINVVDTPGHADFGGEVERVMLVVDGVLLLVDAVDGPMPQTRFVLEKALQSGLKAVVVVNKIDRPDARPDWVVDQTFDLFAALGATDEQLDFPVVYTAALKGLSTLDWKDTPAENLEPLFQTIVDHVPAPKTTGSATDGVQAMVSTIDGDPFLGRLGIGKVFSGTLKTNQGVTVFRRDGTSYNAKVQQVSVYEGLKRAPVDAAVPGDIIAVTGLPEITIGETIAAGENPSPLPPAARRRTDSANDVRGEHVAVLRARRSVFHVAQNPRTFDEGTGNQRFASRQRDRFAGSIRRVRARRIAPCRAD